MKVVTLLQQVRNVTQDNDKTYWDDSEMLGYYNECKRSMAAERLETKTTATMLLEDDKHEYDTTGILRYVSCKDNNGDVRVLYPDDNSGDDDGMGIIIQAYNRIYVNTPTEADELTFKIVALPIEDNLTSDVRVGDEEVFKYYILSKCYEKESDMENFQKSEIFFNKYKALFARLTDSASLQYISNAVDRTSSIFY